MSPLRLPSIQLNANQGLPILFFVAGFPDNQFSGWGTDIPREFLAEKKYHLVFTCLPGLNHTLVNINKFFDTVFGNEGKEVDYSADPSIIIDNDITYSPLTCGFKELFLRLHNTILFACSQGGKIANSDKPQITKRRVTLLGHDWGSYLVSYYVSHRRSKLTKEQQDKEDEVFVLNKSVLMDVGLLNPTKISFKHLILLVFYQLWFCFAFIYSYFLSDVIGTIFFRLFFLPIFKPFWPTTGEKSTVPARLIRGSHCYPYFHMWKDNFTFRPHNIKFPSVPTLFLFGTNKNIMFHDRAFLKRLSDTPGYGFKSFVAGHWFHLRKPDAVIRALTDFIEQD